MSMLLKFFTEVFYFLYLSAKRNIFNVEDRATYPAGALKFLVLLKCNLKETEEEGG